MLYSQDKLIKKKEKFLNNLKDTCNWDLNITIIVNTEGVSLTKIYHEMIEKMSN